MASRRLLTALVATLALPFTVGDAFAQSCEAPPGSSAVDQYCEAIPDADGSTSARRFADRGGSTGPKLPSGTVEELRERGADGATVLRLAGGQATPTAGRPSGGSDGAPSDAGGGSDSDDPAGAGTSSGGPSAGAPAAPSNNPLKAVSSAVQQGDTVGSGFVWMLLVGTLAVAGLGWTSFRRRPDA